MLTGIDGLNAVHGASEKFLVIKGEDVTNRFGDKPLHINGLDVSTLVDAQHGSSVVDVVQRSVDAIRKAGGVPHINHPNFGWAITVAIKPDPYSSYRVQCIGRNGAILSEVISSPAVYPFKGDELYVRAKIIESNGRLGWTQPVWRGR